VKTEIGEEAAEVKHSRGWFMRFKEKRRLCNIQVQGEITHSDAKATEHYPEFLAMIIDKLW
jgi:hypothetical protein